VAIHFPSGETATPATSPAGAPSIAAGTTDFPVATSHTRIACGPPDATSFPSAENAGRTIAGLSAARTSFPAFGSNQRRPASVPSNSVVPSGANRAQ